MEGIENMPDENVEAPEYVELEEPGYGGGLEFLPIIIFLVFVCWFLIS